MDMITYQCPNCNAGLEYHNGLGKFKCRFCDSTFTSEEIKSIFESRDRQVDLDSPEPELTEQQLTEEEFTGQSALYTCPNCGAGVICDSLTSSTRCHFCHTPVILSGRLSGEFKPEYIIPFSTTRDQVEYNFKNFTKGKFLLPNDFSTEAQLKNITALYVPYWLKSGETHTVLDAEGHVVNSWTRGNTTYTHTKVYQVEREAIMTFKRVPQDGSKRINDTLMESIEPFDYNSLEPFTMSYLSGCAAEKYDVTKDEAAKRLDERIFTAADAEIRSMASAYTSLHNVRTAVNYNSQKYSYVLLPVWFLNYTYKGEDYEYAMNGQTGVVFGKLPISPIKKFFFSAGAIVGSLLSITVIGGLLFG